MTHHAISGSDTKMRVTTPVAPLYQSPCLSSEAVSSLLWGEDCIIEQKESAFFKVRSVLDGYQGWIKACTLTEIRAPVTHWVKVRACPLLRTNMVKSSLIALLPFGARLSVKSIHDDWAFLADGSAVRASQIIAADALMTQTPLDIGLECFKGAPYVWGGRASFGIDCSGLMQVLFAATGIQLPRDSGPQRRALKPVKSPVKGSFACFEGHIGLMADTRTLFHANASAMAVTLDPFEAVLELIEKQEGPGRFHGFYTLP